MSTAGPSAPTQSNKRKEPPAPTEASAQAGPKSKKKKKKPNSAAQSQQSPSNADSNDVQAVSSSQTATDDKEEGEIDDARATNTAEAPPVPAAPLVETVALPGPPPTVLTPTEPPKLTKKQRRAARQLALIDQQQSQPIVSLAEYSPKYYSLEKWQAQGPSGLSLEGIKQESTTIISHLLAWGVTPEYVLAAGVSPAIVKIAFDRLHLTLPPSVHELIQQRAPRKPQSAPPQPVPTPQQPAASDPSAAPASSSNGEPEPHDHDADSSSAASLTRTLADLEHEKRLLLLARKSALKRKNQVTAAAFTNEVENLLSAESNSRIVQSDPPAEAGASSSTRPISKEPSPPAAKSSYDANRVNSNVPPVASVAKQHRPRAAEFLSNAASDDDEQNRVVIEFSDSDDDGDNANANDSNRPQDKSLLSVVGQKSNANDSRASSNTPPIPNLSASANHTPARADTPVNPGALNEKEQEIKQLMARIAEMEARKKLLQRKQKEETSQAAKAVLADATVSNTSKLAAESVTNGSKQTVATNKSATKAAPIRGKPRKSREAIVISDSDDTPDVEQDDDDEDMTPPREPSLPASNAESSGTPPRDEMQQDEPSPGATVTPPISETGTETPQALPDEEDTPKKGKAVADADDETQQAEPSPSQKHQAAVSSHFSSYSSPFLRFPALRSTPLPSVLDSADPSPTTSGSNTPLVQPSSDSEAPLRAWVARKALGKDPNKRIYKDVRDFVVGSFKLPARSTLPGSVQDEKQQLFRRGLELKLDALGKPLTLDRARRAAAEYFEEVASMSSTA